MAVYGPVRHQKNIIWTEALRSFGIIYILQNCLTFYINLTIHLIKHIHFS
jgi:hypothetical protein